MRKFLLAGVLLLMLALAACAPTNTTEAEPAGQEGMTEGSMSDDEAAAEDMADDEMSDGAMADEDMSDDEMNDEAMSDDDMDDETMSDDEMDDEAMSDDEMAVAFTVRVENQSVVLAPGVWVVHTEEGPLFVSGEPDRGDGLEALAEDGSPSPLNSALEGYMGVQAHGVFNTPVGASEPGPLMPGDAYEFTFTATPGARLSFATMFVESNDLFYAPEDAGIALFDENGEPISGNITGEISLWDAGTEVNQEPGAGPDQAPRQDNPNTGEDEMGVVQHVSDEFEYPDTADAIQVTISSEQ